MKHNKLVEFLSNLNVKPPLHERKLPPHKRKAPYCRLPGDGFERWHRAFKEGGHPKSEITKIKMLQLDDFSVVRL